MTPTPDSVVPLHVLLRRGVTWALGAFVLMSTALTVTVPRLVSDDAAPDRAGAVCQSAARAAVVPGPGRTDMWRERRPAYPWLAPRPRPTGGAPVGAVASTAASRQTSQLSVAAANLAASGQFAYSAMVRRVARRYSVELKLVMAIIASESGGDPNAVSPAGAVGLMQLMPETASGLGVDPWDPEQNVEGAVRYLSTLLNTFGSVDLSLVAYNAGPGFAMKYREGGVELGPETRAFLTRVGDLLH